MSKQPHCIVCEKPIPKLTTTWFIRQSREEREQTYREVGGRQIVDQHAQSAKPDGLIERGRYSATIYLANRPRSRAECARLTNEEIVYSRLDHEGYVSHFSTWDGVTYQDKFFHSNACAEWFGRQVAEHSGRQVLR
jgi:hypothetical protein